MQKYIKWTEHNDHEGESWSWFIPLEGNEADYEKAKNLLSTAPEYAQDCYEISIVERDLQSLKNEISEADGGYMADKQWADGFGELPDSIDWESDDPFYKGQIFD